MPLADLVGTPPALTGAIRDADVACQRYVKTGSLEDMGTAVARWRDVMNAADFEHADVRLRGGVITELAGTHLDRWKAAGRDADLDAAVDLLTQTQALAPDSDAASYAGANLATVLMARYDQRGDNNDLATAFDLLEPWSKHGDPDQTPTSPLTTLGQAFLYRFNRTGDLADLDAAIQLLGRPQADDPRFSDDARRLNSLGNAFAERYSMTGDAADLDASIDCLEQVLDTAGPMQDFAVAATFANLGGSLRQRYMNAGEIDDLNRAVDLHQEAVRRVPHKWGYHNNLALTLSTRHNRTRERVDLDRAIAGHLRVLAHSEASPDLPGYLTNYAHDLRSRGELDRSVDDLDDAKEMYERACQLGLQSNVELGLVAALHWGLWATQRESWAEATRAYTYGLAASDYLVRTQLTRGRKEAWLSHAQGLPTRAAFALAKLGRLEDATITIERGRALLLTESLERSRVLLEGLADSGRAELGDLFRIAAQDLSALERQELSGPDSADRDRALRETRERLEEIIARIRTVPGNEHFLDPPSLDDLSAISQDAPLVYLLATEAGGLGLIVRGRKITPIWLNELARTLPSGSVDAW